MLKALKSNDKNLIKNELKPGSCSEVEELNEKVQFSSKVHFFGELELNLVHFLAK